MIIERITAQINHYTFKSKKIKEWVEKNCEGITLNLFAGKTKLNIKEIRNDLDSTCIADYHIPAIKLIQQFIRDNDKKFNTILLDPPYSERKSMEYYEGRKISRFTKILDLLPSILAENGIIMTFGYQSAIMGKKRGFEVEKYVYSIMAALSMILLQQ